MELKDYIIKVETDTIYELEKKLVSAKNRLAFLVDYASFSPAEMRLNSNTFMWHGRMPAIFEEHRLIISEKRTQYEEALKVKSSITLNEIVGKSVKRSQKKQQTSKEIFALVRCE